MAIERSSSESGEPVPVRYEASLRAGSAGKAGIARVADLDLDRVADPKGRVRVLVDSDEVERLVASGFEVRLYRVAPVEPVAARLVLDDDAARAWLDRQLEGIEQDEPG